jgi:hypothetical protein
MNPIDRVRTLVTAAAAALLLSAPASAEMTKCRMKYDLDGWSFIYRYAQGSGHITCSNGQSANVRITAHGGGPTLGTEKVIGGTGIFSQVSDISQLYGTYAEAAVHAGAGGSADARAMMKGNVNLSLSGLGQGINLGVAFGAFDISPR